MKHMKKSPLFIAFLLLPLAIPFSCKKFIEQQEKNALVDLVTKGTWRVTRYLDYQNVNLTDSFSGYAFQFNENGTVYSVLHGQQTNGTWSADVSNKTITSNFPTASYPITLLNYTWTITDSYTDSVAAKTAEGASFNILNLHKN
jgi:hypothetical protein